MLTLRCRSAKGASVVKVEGTKSFAEFKKEVETITGIPAGAQRSTFVYQCMQRSFKLANFNFEEIIYQLF